MFSQSYRKRTRDGGKGTWKGHLDGNMLRALQRFVSFISLVYRFPSTFVRVLSLV
jgi:hypothetical protein